MRKFRMSEDELIQLWLIQDYTDLSTLQEPATLLWIKLAHINPQIRFINLLFVRQTDQKTLQCIDYILIVITQRPNNAGSPLPGLPDSHEQDPRQDQAPHEGVRGLRRHPSQITQHLNRLPVYHQQPRGSHQAHNQSQSVTASHHNHPTLLIPEQPSAVLKTSMSSCKPQSRNWKARYANTSASVSPLQQQIPQPILNILHPVEQQLKLYGESIQQQLEESELARSQLLENTRIMIADIKRDNNRLYEQNKALKHEKLKFLQKQEPEDLTTFVENHRDHQASVKNSYDTIGTKEKRQKRFNVLDIQIRKNLKTEESSKTPSKERILRNPYTLDSDQGRMRAQTSLDKKQSKDVHMHSVSSYQAERKREIQKKIRYYTITINVSRNQSRRQIVENTKNHKKNNYSNSSNQHNHSSMHIDKNSMSNAELNPKTLDPKCEEIRISRDTGGPNLSISKRHPHQRSIKRTSLSGRKEEGSVSEMRKYLET